MGRSAISHVGCSLPYTDSCFFLDADEASRHWLTVATMARPDSEFSFDQTPPDGDAQREFSELAPTNANVPADRRLDETQLSGEGAGSSKAVSSEVGSSLGPYRLVERIGQGGMGEVYRAEQLEPIQRTVAVKLIKTGMDTDHVIARFEAERQALAIMDHPNIARVLDAGRAESGHPYFVMELVDGEPIGHFCDTHELSPVDRLQLFQQVCHAVQHAHQKGVIHRDIKPSNVLVAMDNNQPQAKVIDFGLAKATEQRLTEKSIFTQIGQVVGTPAYMSPEQADLGSVDIDTRTDVYSLGVLLYELLTGTTPIEAESLREAAYDEFQRRIREVDPPQMSHRISSMGGGSDAVARKRSTDRYRLAQMLRGDLDVIVMKALEKDRDRRYESPAAFAEDIERFLNHEAIHARRASRVYRLTRFVRRNRLLVTASVLVLASMITGTVVSLLQASRARAAEQLADARLNQVLDEQQNTANALVEMKSQRDRAIQAEETAAEEAAIAKAINEFLKYDLIAEAAPSRNPRGDQVTVEELVLRAAEKIGEKFADRPVLQAELRNMIAEALYALSNLPEAENQFRLSLELMTKHLGMDHADTIQGINNLGFLQKIQGDYDNAERNYKKALELQRDILGNTDRATLGTMNNLAMLYLTTKQYDQAEPLFVESLAGARETLGDADPDTLQSINNLASLYRSMGRYEEALKLFEEALAIRKRELGPEHPDTLVTMSNLAMWHQDRGNYDDATELLTDALGISEHVNGDEHFITLIYRNNLANVHRDAGRTAEAIRLQSAVLASRRKVLTNEHAHTLGSMYTLANLHKSQGDFGKAEPLYREYIVLYRQLYPDSLQLSKTLSAFGLDLVNHDQSAAAVPILRECLEVQAACKANPLQIADARSLLGTALSGEAASLRATDATAAAAQFDEAEQYVVQGYTRIAESTYGRSDEGKDTVATALERVISFYRLRNDEGDAARAEEWEAKRAP